MIWAHKNREKIEASPNERAECPCCKSEVIAKCGEIVSWHWAHKSADCDPWYEPESDWHRNWKARFPKEWQEVVIGPHRADVKAPNFVIEFQRSPISPAEIKERETFYDRMVWVLCGEDFKSRFDAWEPSFQHKCRDCGYVGKLYLRCMGIKICPSCRGPNLGKLKPHWKFKWKWERTSWRTATKPIIFDFTDHLLFTDAERWGRADRETPEWLIREAKKTP